MFSVFLLIASRQVPPSLEPPKPSTLQVPRLSTDSLDRRDSSSSQEESTPSSTNTPSVKVPLRKLVGSPSRLPQYGQLNFPLTEALLQQQEEEQKRFKIAREEYERKKAEKHQMKTEG